MTDFVLLSQIFHKLQSYPLDESNYVHIFIVSSRCNNNALQCLDCVAVC